MKYLNEKDQNKWYWTGDPACEEPNALEQLMIDRRNDLEIVGGIEDEDLSYEYDEYVVVRLDGMYYLLHTCGCSCPSPTETWCVVNGPCCLNAIRNVFTSGKYAGYTLPGKKLKELLEMLDEVEKNS